MTRPTSPEPGSPPSRRPTPLGVIGGSAFLDRGRFAGTERRQIDTPRGAVTANVGPDFVFLQRHGEGVYRPPHRIPHHAHVLALEALGVRHVAGFASCGSLHADLLPGDVVVPVDYVSWHDPPTFGEDEYLHIVPALDARIRGFLVRGTEGVLGSGPARRRALRLSSAAASTSRRAVRASRLPPRCGSSRRTHASWA